MRAIDHAVNQWECSVGAELKHLCTEAALAAAANSNLADVRVAHADFVEVQARMQPALSASDIAAHAKWQRGDAELAAG